jgi:hypothetical protein
MQPPRRAQPPRRRPGPRWAPLHWLRLRTVTATFPTGPRPPPGWCVCAQRITAGENRNVSHRPPLPRPRTRPHRLAHRPRPRHPVPRRQYRAVQLPALTSRLVRRVVDRHSAADLSRGVVDDRACARHGCRARDAGSGPASPAGVRPRIDPVRSAQPRRWAQLRRVPRPRSHIGAVLCRCADALRLDRDRTRAAACLRGHSRLPA